MILAEAGEIGVHVGDRTIVLRPSLYAISTLGTPDEIAEIFGAVMGPKPPLPEAVAVLWACTDTDISELTGYLDVSENEARWIEGTLPLEHVGHLARSLLRHGIVGAID